MKKHMLLICLGFLWINGVNTGSFHGDYGHIEGKVAVVEFPRFRSQSMIQSFHVPLTTAQLAENTDPYNCIASSLLIGLILPSQWPLVSRPLISWCLQSCDYPGFWYPDGVGPRDRHSSL